MTSLRISALVRRRANSYAALLALLCALPCSAQQDPTYTLHVYTNLVQIPVLIRSPHFDYVPKVDPAKLTVAIDGGKPFHPDHIRPEAGDPISLAIILDTADGNNGLLPDFSRALVKAAGRKLHPEDRVALYILNCRLQIASLFVAPDAAQLKLAADSAVGATRRPVPCPQPLHLRDALALLTGEFSNQHGRSVVLAITDGRDNGSKVTPEHLDELAADAGIAIFGLAASSQNEMMVSQPIGRGGRNPPPPPSTAAVKSYTLVDRNFDNVCRISGGLAVMVPPETLPSALASFVDMVRDRFIIEFPPPKTSGSEHFHNILITLADSNAYIHPAGVSISMPDPTLPAQDSALQPAPIPATQPPH